jgi:AcrR family transcriptional regulator
LLLFLIIYNQESILVKIQRSPEEIEAVREDIMTTALDLIVSEGYDGFTMRKLGTRLGVAAKTIYNYFHNQDELYLCILTKGFEQLLERFETATKPHNDPMAQLGASIRAYIDFGIEHANIYNLMFTLHVPKFNDYMDTPMEQAAQVELDTALKCADFFMDRINACLGDGVAVKESDTRCELIRIWSQMHGYVAGINNTLLDYMHDHPIDLKSQMIDRIISTSQRELTALRQRLKLKVTRTERKLKA